MCDPNTHAATPLWASCQRCKEPIMPDAQGIMSPLAEPFPPPTRGMRITWFIYHLDCYLKGILPHGKDCPHCRGIDIDQHAPGCTNGTIGICSCQPMPAGAP